MAAAPPHPIDGRSLTLDIMGQLAQGRSVSLCPSVVETVENSRRVVEQVLSEGTTVYGINTGFGRLSSVRIAPAQVVELQKNLVRSHCAGVGAPLRPALVRTMMILRLNSLVQGYSGVRKLLLDTLVGFINREIYPVVPSRGSVGASGDLAPLAHIALGLMGEGNCLFEGEILPVESALARTGLLPVEFEAKEALALINGTQLMSGAGALALLRARNLLKCADVIAAMSLEALMGTDAVFHPAIHQARPHPGQVAVADNLRTCLQQSALIESHRHCSKVQDPYSLRCVPQVHGATREGWLWARQVVEREMNSATDNPVVLLDEGRIVSGGNFHGAPVALVLDSLAVALSYLASISERRCDKLLNPDESGLPAFLTREQGLHSGLMLVQYGSAALVNENKILCHPASADSIPTSAGHEDHVSMGPSAAYKLERLLRNTEQVLANEWVCACQALEFHRPLTFGPGTELGLELLRQHVSSVTHDRVLNEDLEIARSLIADGKLVKAVESSLGALE